jgi:hypothetical protein
LNYFVEKLSIDRSVYCASKEDVGDASAMMMLMLGARNGAGKDSIRFSEACLGVSFEEHTRFLETLWKTWPSSVCFAVDKGVRLGASVVYPCTEEWYMDLRSGRKEFFDIQPSSILPKSNFVILHGVIENPELDMREKKAKRSLLQIKTTLNQFALACHPLPEASPRFLVFSPDIHGEERAAAYKFRRLENVTPRTRKPIFEFCKPSEGKSSRLLGHYWAMLVVLGLIQNAQAFRDKIS